MRKAQLVSAVLLLVVAAGMAAAARHLPLWEEGRGLGGGALPLVLCVALGVFGLGVALEAWAARDASPIAWPPRSASLRMGAVVGGMAAYALLTPWLGFALTTALVSAGVLRLISRFRWRLVVGTSVGMAFLFTLVFQYALGMPLPRGPWGF